MIVLYGATGYTGNLIAEVLAARKEAFVVAGRSPEKLRALVRELATRHEGVDVDSRVASVDDPAALAAAFEGADVVVSAAGPFELCGEPVVAATVAAGAAYCDTTGETGFMRRVIDDYADAPVPIIPAAGFDYVPHNMAARLAIEACADPANLESVETAQYVKRMAVSQGTMRSAMGAVLGTGTERAAGRLVTARFAQYTRTFEFPPPIGAMSAVSTPTGDAVQVELMTDAPNVRGYFIVSDSAARALRLTGGGIEKMLGVGLVQRGFDKLVDRASEGPSPDRRAASTFGVIAEARSGNETRRAFAAGRDVYGSTAVYIVRLAEILESRPGGLANGVLAPAQAVDDPQKFAAECGFELDLVP